MTDSSSIATNRIINADAFDAIEGLPADSVHALVTDPPYGLAFMGRDWDDFEPEEYQQWCRDWSSEAMRVLKPGGHLLAFSGSRTHHRLFAGVEDAGYELRDTLTWHYGGGFPKALDVSKAIDNQADAEREVVKEHPHPAQNDPGGNSLHMSEKGMPDGADITAPATDEAKRWDGFKTALKPATEFITLARKPFSGTVAENVLEHGTSALNIDECRIEHNEEKKTTERGRRETNTYAQDEWTKKNFDSDSEISSPSQKGRYPSNLVLSPEAARRLDEQSGTLPKGGGSGRGESGDGWGLDGQQITGSLNFNDSGGASRFYYCSKASKSERTLDGKIENAHPTVKPVDLMEWLVKLATAEGQIVLDPFAGSGTTLLAAKNVNRKFVGIEQQSKWADVARVRCGLTPEDPSVVRSGENMGLEAFADGGSNE